MSNLQDSNGTRQDKFLSGELLRRAARREQGWPLFTTGYSFRPVVQAIFGKSSGFGCAATCATALGAIAIYTSPRVTRCPETRTGSVSSPGGRQRCNDLEFPTWPDKPTARRAGPGPYALCPTSSGGR